MATIIDSLLVSLGLETSEFKKGIDESEKDHGKLVKKVEEGGKKLSDADKKAGKEKNRQHKEEQRAQKQSLENMNKMRNQVLGMIGLFTAGKGILNFVKDTVASTAALDRMSEVTGVSINELGGWNQALERTGGTAEEMQNTIRALSQETAKYKQGLESTVIEYAFWQGSMQHGELDKTRNYLLGIADVLQRLNKLDPQKAMLAASKMGISENVFNLLKLGRIEVERQVASGAKLAAITSEQGKEARKAQAAWADMATQLQSVLKPIIFGVLKAIGGWMEKHGADISRWVENLKQAIAGFTPETIEKVGAAIGKIVDALMMAVKLMGSLYETAQKLGLVGEGTQKEMSWMDKNPKVKEAAKTISGGSSSLVAKGVLDMMSMFSNMMYGGGNKTSNNSSQTTINISTRDDPHSVGRAALAGVTQAQMLATQANGF
jgi:hypothetical protein